VTHGNNAITGTPAPDLFRLSQGGDDTVDGLEAMIASTSAKPSTGWTQSTGGAGFDTLILAGDYMKTALVIGAAGLTSIERILVKDGFSYDITTNDSNVAAGEMLLVDGHDLGPLHELRFDGSAETDGRFTIIGGDGNDQLTGGMSDDLLYRRRRLQPAGRRPRQRHGQLYRRDRAGDGAPQYRPGEPTTAMAPSMAWPGSKI
jgi:Ca2+-binding RTX toxin-like protein